MSRRWGFSFLAYTYRRMLDRCLALASFPPRPRYCFSTSHRLWDVRVWDGYQTTFTSRIACSSRPLARRWQRSSYGDSQHQFRCCSRTAASMAYSRDRTRLPGRALCGRLRQTRPFLPSTGARTSTPSWSWPCLLLAGESEASCPGH